MATLQVNDDGAVLAYTDTGALETPYNTIFLSANKHRVTVAN
jgi:hypothetical protein